MQTRLVARYHKGEHVDVNGKLFTLSDIPPTAMLTMDSPDVVDWELPEWVNGFTPDGVLIEVIVTTRDAPATTPGQAEEAR